MLAQPLLNMPGNGGDGLPINSGDVMNLRENLPVAVSGAANFTIDATQLARADLKVSGGAGVNMTWPTASQIIAALQGSINVMSPPGNALYGTLANQSVQTQWPSNLQPFEPGSTFRRSIYNNNGGTLTSVAGSGITLDTSGGGNNIATVKWREFLIMIQNSSPQQILSGTTTNASAVLSNLDPTLIQNITNGMLVTGTGIGAAPNRVVAVNRDLGTVTVSVVSTATATNIAITFSPEVVVCGLRAGDV